MAVGIFFWNLIVNSEHLFSIMGYKTCSQKPHIWTTNPAGSLRTSRYSPLSWYHIHHLHLAHTIIHIPDHTLRIPSYFYICAYSYEHSLVALSHIHVTKLRTRAWTFFLSLLQLAWLDLDTLQAFYTGMWPLAQNLPGDTRLHHAAQRKDKQQRFVTFALYSTLHIL